ncbi:MAG: tRNA (guanosine(46)-N7)-methyltransferase TrmB [Clostridiales bacterium]|nr:tRNA (guanosine(46)-N7)-methyltransferase TrmB [Clostridiales bacterium]
MRVRKKKNLIPRMERCSEFLVNNPQELKGKWSEACANGRPIYLEIGCGKGRFIVETAEKNPDIFFLAMEREENVLVTALETAKGKGCSNVLFLLSDASEIENIFGRKELSRIYINFCDPWPPKKQAKRRLTHKNFLIRYQSVLTEKGEIHFKTDNEKLFEFSLNEISEFGFTLKNISLNLHASDTPNIMTEYEEKFSSQGMKIYRLEAFLRSLTDQ